MPRYDSGRTLTTPLGWLAVAGLVLIIGMALAWSVVGRLPLTVSGQGILLASGEVWTVTSPGNGKIGKMLVGRKDHVVPGELVAVIEQPELQLAVTQAGQRFADLVAAQQSMERFENTAAAEHSASWADKEAELKAQIARLDKDLAAGSKLAQGSQGLLKLGFETVRDALSYQTAVSADLRSLGEAKFQLVSLDSERVDYNQQRHRRAFELDIRVSEARHEFNTKQAELAIASRVISKYEGDVIEVSTEAGRDTHLGDKLFRLEPTARKLIAQLYLPAGRSKRVQAAMPARLAAESFDKQEFGYIVGQVTDVSLIPESEETLLIDLASKGLVQQMMKDGPPVRCTVALQIDPATASGLRWSSSRGPAQAVTEGTLVQAEIIIEYRRPIELAIPLLKSLLGV